MTKRMIVATLALAGIFISAYLTLYKLGMIGELSCTVGSCETVNTSKYATFLGAPVAGWGVFFYVSVFIFALLGTTARLERHKGISALLVMWSTVGLLFSAWLTYLELAVIQAVCIWCVVSAVLVVIIFALSVLDLREQRSTPAGYPPDA